MKLVMIMGQLILNGKNSGTDYKEEGKWQMGDLGELKINPFAFQLFEVGF